MSGPGRLHVAATRRRVETQEESCHRSRQPGQPRNTQQSVPTQLLLRLVGRLFLKDVLQVNSDTRESVRVDVVAAHRQGGDILYVGCISDLMIGLDFGLLEM